MSQNTGIINNPCSSSSPVWHVRVRAIDRAIFVWPWKMVSVSVRYYLFCQPINVKIKTWSLRFPAKQNPNMEKIGQLCCSMTSKRSIDWFLESTSGVKFFHSSVRLTNQKPRAFVSVRWTNQIAPANKIISSVRQISSISVNLLFLCCSRVFVSRSYENRGASSFLDDSSLNYGDLQVWSLFERNGMYHSKPKRALEKDIQSQRHSFV